MSTFYVAARSCARCAVRTRIVQFQQTRQRHVLSSYRKSDRSSPRHYNAGGNGYGLKKVATFDEVLQERLNIVRDKVKTSPLLKRFTSAGAQQADDGEGGRANFSYLWREYVKKIPGNFARRREDDFNTQQQQPSDGRFSATDFRNELFAAHRSGGKALLDARLQNFFWGHVAVMMSSQTTIERQRVLADLRYPSEWYPATRGVQRTIHLHVGPTNSGKTYQALKKLENAQSGVYAGPLRLLAHEVYSRMNAKGRSCFLITGEERRKPLDGTTDGDDEDACPLSSCTVEMINLNRYYDVAIIDEIQMIGSQDRGWAWTAAVLGVKAKEVHLCGEERAVPIIEELCASIGEKLVIHRYERLSPLATQDRSLEGDWTKLRKGDCVVSFSIKDIHALRTQIQNQTGKKVAIVYGSLPPETRAQQARLFNDPNNDYDYLVASDAIGMGLNLAIKRVIFETTAKFDGYNQITLPISDIKQIGGRAGRFRTAAQVNDTPVDAQDLAAAKGDIPDHATRPPSRKDESVGLVTTFQAFDLPIVKKAMNATPPPIKTAGIFPPARIMERFASYFPVGTPFSFLMVRLQELSQLPRTRFHLCGLKDQLFVADLIEPVEGLTISDKYTICACPASRSDIHLWRDLLPAYARCIAEQSGGNILDIPELPIEILDLPEKTDREYLQGLERLHKGIVTYLWLSYRFAGVFTSRPTAVHIKGLVEEKIEKCLSQVRRNEKARKHFQEIRMRQVKIELEEQEKEREEGEEKAPVTMLGMEEQSQPSALTAATM